MPASATEKPAQGEVLAVGPGKRLENGDTQPIDLKVGDVVVFGKYYLNLLFIESTYRMSDIRSVHTQ